MKKVYTIIASTGHHSDYSEYTLFASLDLDVVTSTFDNMVDELSHLFKKMSMNTDNHYSDSYNVSEYIWNIASDAVWGDYMRLHIMTMPMDSIGCMERVRYTTINCNGWESDQDNTSDVQNIIGHH